MPKIMTLPELVKAYRHLNRQNKHQAEAKVRALLDVVDEMAGEVAASLSVDSDWPKIDTPEGREPSLNVGFYPRRAGDVCPKILSIQKGNWLPMEQQLPATTEDEGVACE